MAPLQFRQPASSQAPARGVEWEYERLVLPRDIPRSFVTRLLVERAEHGGWELVRVRITPDGVRRVVLRRRIIRQVRASAG